MPPSCMIQLWLTGFCDFFGDFLSGGERRVVLQRVYSSSQNVDQHLPSAELGEPVGQLLLGNAHHFPGMTLTVSAQPHKQIMVQSGARVAAMPPPTKKKERLVGGVLSSRR